MPISRNCSPYGILGRCNRRNSKYNLIQIKFLETDKKSLTTTTYNIQGLSFSCEEIVYELKKHYPDFANRYEPDFRDKIAKTWPQVLDDKLASNDWGWNPYCKDVRTLVDKILKFIRTN